MKIISIDFNPFLIGYHAANFMTSKLVSTTDLNEVNVDYLVVNSK